MDGERKEAIGNMLDSMQTGEIRPDGLFDGASRGWFARVRTSLPDL